MSEENEAVALLPCPFCGGSPWVHEYKERHSARVTGWLVTCKECGAEASHTADVRETAFEAWNRRTDRSDSTVTITALQSQVRTLTERVVELEAARADLMRLRLIEVQYQELLSRPSVKLANIERGLRITGEEQKEWDADVAERDALRSDLASARAEVERLRGALQAVTEALAEYTDTCEALDAGLAALAPQTKEDE